MSASEIRGRTPRIRFAHAGYSTIYSAGAIAPLDATIVTMTSALVCDELRITLKLVEAARRRDQQDT